MLNCGSLMWSRFLPAQNPFEFVTRKINMPSSFMCVREKRKHRTARKTLLYLFIEPDMPGLEAHPQ